MPTDAGTTSVEDARKDAAAPGDAAVDSGPPQDNLDSLEFHPSFEPDYNHLVPQPWVDVATTMQQQTATVRPDKLIFPLADNAEVSCIEANGTAANRLTAEGVGPDKPLESNETEAGRHANRRVEFHIVENTP